ncbi:putative nonspeCific lipid-transfer protein [Luminiphilus syltensis NOR5-1B]|uniref:Putative nonspeCific lipid-transfer protein n=1 Tax=Luminiphilus syltensis NOR5-1B TaxID=565045 RepID=B8KUI1_9GAMM|nr:transporter [Luminiphilus syltensis]EED34113.1 putative nonspeCific lipid-transfer protein [Luminiphilus syltensis NOR5-1B]
MSEGVYVAGAGAIPWGKRPETTQLAMAIEALNAAFLDAGIGWEGIEGLVAASSRFEGGMGWGLHANEILQAVSERAISCINVGGACAAGAIAFNTAYSMIASGQHDSVAVIGAERMPKGFIPRPPGSQDDISDSDFLRWVTMGATNPAYWALEAQRRRYDFGTSDETLARASVLMRSNAAANPYARFRDPLTIEEVLASPMVADPLHLLQICPVSDGAAAVVLGSRKFAEGTGRPLVEVAGCAIGSGQFGDPARRIPTISNTVLEGVAHTSEVTTSVKRAMEMASVDLPDIDVLEMADNTSWHLLAWPELFGFVEPGQSDWMINNGRFAINGDLALNPSGGFLSFGEATTAQAVLQVCELVWQLRGEAVGRQVTGARVGMSAVLGLAGNGGSIVLKR